MKTLILEVINGSRVQLNLKKGFEINFLLYITFSCHINLEQVYVFHHMKNFHNSDSKITDYLTVLTSYYVSIVFTFTESWHFCVEKTKLLPSGEMVKNMWGSFIFQASAAFSYWSDTGHFSRKSYFFITFIYFTLW